MLFTAKNYLWPENGTKGLNRPPGAEDVKCTGEGVENLAGVQLANTINSHHGMQMNWTEL